MLPRPMFSSMYWSTIPVVSVCNAFLYNTEMSYIDAFI
nr:MAG TPA: hypothetical protein [Caudoviricetes sp.]